MELSNCGLLALFIGDLKASQQANVGLHTIEHSRNLITFENSPCFAKLKNFIVELCNAHGIENTSEYLSFPEEVLELLCTAQLEPEKSAPGLPQTECPSVELTKKRPRTTNPILDELDKLPLRERVKILCLKQNVNYLAIRKLYDLPSIQLIRNWGEYTRIRDIIERTAQIEQRNQILDLKALGQSNGAIAEKLNISLKKVFGHLCDSQRTKIIYSSAEIKDFIRESRVAKKTKPQMATELGIPPITLQRALEGSHSIIKAPWYISDDEGHSIEKVKAVEGFFLLEDAEIVGEHYGVLPALVSKWAASVQEAYQRAEDPFS